jgi:hypothetical protein
VTRSPRFDAQLLGTASGPFRIKGLAAVVAGFGLACPHFLWIVDRPTSRPVQACVAVLSRRPLEAPDRRTSIPGPGMTRARGLAGAGQRCAGAAAPVRHVRRREFIVATNLRTRVYSGQQCERRPGSAHFRRWRARFLVARSERARPLGALQDAKGAELVVQAVGGVALQALTTRAT